VAELSLEVGNPDEAFTAFARLREIDDVPGHETYPLHGMIKAEIQREHWQHALELAQEAASGDAQGRTAGVIVFLRDQAGVPAEAEAEEEQEEAPTREQVDAALDASLSEYRRLHADDRRLAAEDLLG
jgi:hypothetical protein